MRDILMPVYFARKIGALRLLKRIVTVLIFVLSKWTWIFMKVSKTNSTFIIIKRLISLSIAGVSVIALTLLYSFAKDSISPVTSPMPEPVPSIVSGSDYDTVTLFYVVQWNASFAGSDTKYNLYEMICKIPHGASAVLNIKRQQTALFFSGDRLPPYTVNVYDVLTGSLVGSYGSANFQSYGSVNGFSSSYGFRSGYFPENNGFADVCAGGFGIVPDGISITGGESVYNSAPFVTWSQQPSEHNVYHSELSEPVADEYNSYFICNDRLYWLSYRANGLYSFTQNFELSSQLYQEDVSYSSSGQGTYAGQANGFTVEPVSISDGSFAGVGTGGTPVVGVYSGFNMGQISYVGVNTGNLRVNSSGQMTYNDLEVYPVSVNSQFLNRLFDIIVYLTDDTGFKIWLVPRSDLGQNLVLDASLYCSCFDLTNGDYISSSFSSYTGNYQYAGFDYALEDKIESVRCYGCAFHNVYNIPVHLSDVFWGYDLEFKEWRDNMLQKLTQIYNLLNHSDSLPETTTSSFGSSVEGLSDPSYSEVSPEQVGNELNNAWDQNPDIVNNSGFVKGWISDFSIPKIIALCVLALASGTVILTLGKNKADS